MKKHESPYRTCFLTGEELTPSELIRFVKGPEDKIYPDLWCKLTGRGAWIKAEKELLLESLSDGRFKKGLERSMKTKISFKENEIEFVERIERALIKRCAEFLGLEKKAGRLISGYEKVSSAIKKERLSFLIEADDASQDGAKKLKALAEYHRGEILWVNVFSRDELSRALGGENIVHVGIFFKGISTRMKQEVLRLISFRGKSVQVLGVKI